MATTSRRRVPAPVDQGNRAAQHGSGIFDRLRGNDDLAAVLVLPEVVRAEDDGMHAGLSCGLDLVPDCPDCSKAPIGPDPPGPGKRATAIARAGERGRDGHARVEAPAFEQPAQADGQGDTQRAAADVRLAAHALQMPPHPAPANELVPDQRPSVDQAPAEVFVENHATERNRIGEETGGLIKCARGRAAARILEGEPFQVQTGRQSRLVLPAGPEASFVEEDVERNPPAALAQEMLAGQSIARIHFTSLGDGRAHHAHSGVAGAPCLGLIQLDQPPQQPFLGREHAPFKVVFRIRAPTSPAAQPGRSCQPKMRPYADTASSR